MYGMLTRVLGLYSSSGFLAFESSLGLFWNCSAMFVLSCLKVQVWQTCDAIIHQFPGVRCPCYNTVIRNAKTKKYDTERASQGQVLVGAWFVCSISDVASWGSVTIYCHIFHTVFWLLFVCVERSGGKKLRYLFIYLFIFHLFVSDNIHARWYIYISIKQD